MFVVVLIVVPLLVQTIGDTVVVGGEPSEAPSSEAAVASSEAPADDGDAAEGSNVDGDFPADYTVEAGDTGTKISQQFYDSDDGWATIAEANDIDPSAPLRVGEELTIPAPQ